MGLPGRRVNPGAGDGWEGGGITGEVLASEGDVAAVGVGSGVVEAEYDEPLMFVKIGG